MGYGRVSGIGMVEWNGRSVVCSVCFLGFTFLLYNSLATHIVCACSVIVFILAQMFQFASVDRLI